MRFKYLIRIIIISLVFIAGIVIGVFNYQKTKEAEFINEQKLKKAEFIDEEMKYIITTEAIHEGITKEKETFNKDHFDDIKELNIGYVANYESILDIAKCEQLEYFSIGMQRGYISKYFRNMDETIPQSLEEERIEILQEELTQIFQECPNISWFCLINEEKSCNVNSLDFLKNANNIFQLTLRGVSVTDYSVVYNISSLKYLHMRYCNINDLSGIEKLTNLKSLSLDYANIDEATDILKINSLEKLSIVGTPLAENEEEIQKIYDKFPEIRIILER